MPTVPAPNWLAALQRDILIAIAALVVHGARVGIDGGSGGVLRAAGLLGLVAGVGLRGHGCGRGGVGFGRLGMADSDSVVACESRVYVE